MFTLRFIHEKKPVTKNVLTLSLSSTHEIAKIKKCNLCSGRCDAVPAGGLQVEHSRHHQLWERVPPQGASHQSQGQKVQPHFFHIRSFLQEFVKKVLALKAVFHPDPHVFGLPGSGFISQRFRSGSGSGSFYHQAKIVRKTLIPTVLRLLFYFFIINK